MLSDLVQRKAKRNKVLVQEKKQKYSHLLGFAISKTILSIMLGLKVKIYSIPRPILVGQVHDENHKGLLKIGDASLN